MEQPNAAPYPVSDFLQWDGARQLVLVPKFQRRLVWSEKARSFLIDTILRSFSIPPVYLRLKMDGRKMIREVVDGQQRLNTILSFVRDEFAILKVHNVEHGNKRFSELSDEAKAKILSYKIMAYTLENVSDADVLSLFARLNTYTEKLTSQELINAAYFGAFKQAVYDTAHRHHVFWTSHKILTDRKIVRMGDAELVSLFFAVMLDGIREFKSGAIRHYYEIYDNEFLRSESIQAEFDFIIDLIGTTYGDKLRASPYRRAPLFFTLFFVLYDQTYGLSERKESQYTWTNERVQMLRESLDAFADLIGRISLPVDIERFNEATQRGTANAANRRERHRIFAEYVLKKVL